MILKNKKIWIFITLLTIAIVGFSFYIRFYFNKKIKLEYLQYKNLKVTAPVSVLVKKCYKNHHSKSLLQSIFNQINPMYPVYKWEESLENLTPEQIAEREKAPLALVEIDNDYADFLLEYHLDGVKSTKYKKLVESFKKSKRKSICKDCAYQIKPAKFRFVKEDSLIWQKTEMGGYYKNGATLTISAPLFNKQKNIAIVLISQYQASLGRRGQIVVFELLKNKWEAHPISKWVS